MYRIVDKQLCRLFEIIWASIKDMQFSYQRLMHKERKLYMHFAWEQ